MGKFLLTSPRECWPPQNKPRQSHTRDFTPKGSHALHQKRLPGGTKPDTKDGHTLLLGFPGFVRTLRDVGTTSKSKVKTDCLITLILELRVCYDPGAKNTHFPFVKMSQLKV